MAGRPKTRAKLAAARNGHPVLPSGPKFKYLADIYAERYTTFDALRHAMLSNGIVEHGVNPYDCIQRAIDDVTTDYLLLRNRIDKDTRGDPELLIDHPLYDYMERMREAMVRYSTFAMQYDIQKRQLKLSETRVAVMAQALRITLTQLGFNHDQIRQAPRMLIEAIQAQEPKTNAHAPAAAPSKLDPQKAEALAEILANDTVVEVIDVEEP